MADNNPVRIDKYLWAVRIYKTRSIAADECKKGRILINNVQVKPSRTIEKGEILSVKKPPVIYTYKVIEPIENRVGAKIVMSFIEDLTPRDEKLKLDINKTTITAFREKGTGRPTKKERRVIDKWHEGLNDY